jgi:hypothetical protein
MQVFELMGTAASDDWASRGVEKRLGLFSSAQKAEDKIESIKQGKEWKMDWSSFRVVESEVL